MSRRIADDDLNGIWWVAYTEGSEDWPASVVEALAAELIEARGGSTLAVKAAMQARGSKPVFQARPMGVARHDELTTHIVAPVAPEFDPREVEEDVFDQPPAT